MSEKTYYLREDVYFEPLFNQWYAWPYLLPPAPGSRHMVNTHRRIMNSFVNNYQLHIMASQEPGMAGGEFLNCTEAQVDDIKGLIEDIDNNQQDLLELNEAIKQMDELVANHTSGKTIDYLYGEVPQALKGYVEIYMDMEHRAGYRFIESLLYRSKYYKPQLQSLSFGLLSKVEERPFVLSTPRLPDENHLQIKADYNHQVVDKIFAARNTPIGESELKALFDNLALSGGLDYMSLFSEKAPEIVHQPVTEGVRLEYLGHAGFLLESKDVSVLIDPVIASRGEAYAGDLVSFSELPEKIDYICLTHNHQDHVNIETLLQLRHKTDKIIVPRNNGGTLVDPSIRLLLKQFKFNVLECDDLDEFELPGGRIVAIPFLGEHGDLHIRSKTAWYVELEGKKLYFGADSSNPDNALFEHLGAHYGDIDILAIGMECVGAPYTWIYGALHTKPVPKAIKKSRRLNGSDFEQAYPIVKAFNAKEVYIYALGMEPWYKYFMGLEYDDDSAQIVQSKQMIEACEADGIPAKMMVGKHCKVLV